MSSKLYAYATNVVPGPEEDRFYLPLSNGLLAGTAANIIISGFTGKGMAMVFGLVNFIQLINLIPLMPLNLPSHVRWLFRKLDFANMGFNIFSKLYNYLFNVLEYNENSDAYTYWFDDNGYNNRTILANAGDSYIMLAIFLALWPVMIILAILMKIFSSCK